MVVCSNYRSIGVFVHGALLLETMKKKIFILILLSFLFLPEASAQCAMCRAVLESGETKSAAEGINDGIVYLMAFPYLLMAGVAYFIWKSRRKNRIREQ